MPRVAGVPQLVGTRKVAIARKHWGFETLCACAPCVYRRSDREGRWPTAVMEGPRTGDTPGSAEKPLAYRGSRDCQVHRTDRSSACAYSFARCAIVNQAICRENACRSPSKCLRTAELRCCGVIERLDLRATLPNIAAPTLTIAGAQDPVTPPAHLEAIAARIPRARLEVLDGAAHLANIERAEGVNRLIREHCLGAIDA